MGLEINSSHKKANIPSHISDKFKKRLAAVALGSVIVVSLFSGCSSNNIKEDVQSSTVSMVSDAGSENSEIEEMIEESTVDKDTVVDIPDSYVSFVSSACSKSEGDKITVGDLAKIKELTMPVIDSDSSLDWLNYCTNMESMMLSLNCGNSEIMKSVKRLDSLRSLSLMTNESIEFNDDNFPFVKSSKKLESIDLDGFNYEPGYLESMTQLKKLTLNIGDKCDLDFKKLTFLDDLNFGDSLPYDIAIRFSSEDYKTLVNNDVSIAANNPVIIDKVVEINDKLDGIVKGLGLNDDSTDEEKLNAILIYTLDNLTYDEDVSEALVNGNADGLADEFYKEGYLYGALEMDSAICGNYSALVEALANRVKLNSHILNSNNHAWNLVSVEGNNYYVDATWLDGKVKDKEVVSDKYDEQGRLVSRTISYDSMSAQDVIKEGNGTELDWYMEDPTKIDDIDQKNSHVAVDVPTYIEIKPINEQSDSKEEASTGIVDITDNKYEVKSGDNNWIIAGGALVGILAAAGGAVGVGIHHKKKKDQRRRLQQLNDMNFSSFDSYGGGSSFGRRY